LAAPDDNDALTLFFARSSIVAIASSQSLLQRPTPTPSAGLIVSARGTTFARFMPSYLKLPKLPKHDLMSVFRASAWHCRLGPLDSTAAAIAERRLPYVDVVEVRTYDVIHVLKIQIRRDSIHFFSEVTPKS
jgi:hypothetical protein